MVSRLSRLEHHLSIYCRALKRTWNMYIDPMWTSLRSVETTANPDGSATTHVVVRCTLADIARATNLRVEDAAFALNECGLLVRGGEKGGGGGGSGLEVGADRQLRLGVPEGSGAGHVVVVMGVVDGGVGGMPHDGQHGSQILVS